MKHQVIQNQGYNNSSTICLPSDYFEYSNIWPADFYFNILLEYVQAPHIILTSLCINIKQDCSVTKLSLVIAVLIKKNGSAMTKKHVHITLSLVTTFSQAQTAHTGEKLQENIFQFIGHDINKDSIILCRTLLHSLSIIYKWRHLVLTLAALTSEIT